MDSAEKDRAEGTWDRTKGKVKEGAGRVTGDRDLEAEGKADQAEGSLERAKGHVKEAGKRVKEGVEDLTK
jgi:uncharacterized protein YjbJ (UPF0337 family)